MKLGQHVKKNSLAFIWLIYVSVLAFVPFFEEVDKPAMIAIMMACGLIMRRSFDRAFGRNFYRFLNVVLLVEFVLAFLAVYPQLKADAWELSKIAFAFTAIVGICIRRALAKRSKVLA